MTGRALKRILMTADTVGGVWTFAVELAEALGKHGVEVLLATLGGRAPRPVRLPNVRVAESNFKLEWMEDPWADVEASRDWILRLAREFQPDVVHLNSFGHGALPWKAPVVLTAHSCVLSWWKAVHACEAPAEWDRYRWEVERALRAVDLVVTPSHAMLEAIEDHYGVSGRVIYNGRDRRRFHSGNKQPIVLTAGRLWDQGKNVAAVARVAPKLPWPCYVAGDGSAEGCRALGVLSNDELADWYGRASIYALPARYEPFGLSALEAALSGCALVLGDIASLREIWGDAAAYAGDLEGEIRKLIENPIYRAEMAGRAWRRAQCFTAERMAEEYLATYEAAVAAPVEALCAS